MWCKLSRHFFTCYFEVAHSAWCGKVVKFSHALSRWTWKLEAFQPQKQPRTHARLKFTHPCPCPCTCKNINLNIYVQSSKLYGEWEKENLVFRLRNLCVKCTSQCILDSPTLTLKIFSQLKHIVFIVCVYTKSGWDYFVGQKVFRFSRLISTPEIGGERAMESRVERVVWGENVLVWFWGCQWLKSEDDDDVEWNFSHRILCAGKCVLKDFHGNFSIFSIFYRQKFHSDDHSLD